MTTMSTQSRLIMSQPIPAGLEPTTGAFVQSLGALKGAPIEELSVTDARSNASTLQAGIMPMPKLPVAIEDRIIPGGPGGEIPIRIVLPDGPHRELPAVMYFHGGGWVLNDKESYDRTVRELAHGASAAVVFVNYTRSPEARYPVAVEEAYAATRWVASNGATLQLDAARLAVAGDSSGGQHGCRGDASRQRANGPNARMSGALLSNRGRRLRYGLVPEVCGWTLSYPQRNEMVLVPLCSGRGPARGADGVTAPSI
jgi:acetyl esterase